MNISNHNNRFNVKSYLFLPNFVVLIISCLILFCNHGYSQNIDDYSDEEFSLFESEFEANNSIYQDKIYDPLESVNRKIYIFNDYFDRYSFTPFIKIYHKNVPQQIRNSIHNFSVNISLPMSFFNSLLQGKSENSVAIFSSFVVNSTIGIFGLFDVAGKKNIKYYNEDFGQTLGKYGVSTGPYLVLPFLGPSDLRDFSGQIVDTSIDPMRINILNLGHSNQDLIDGDARIANAFVNIVDSRSQFDDIVVSTRENAIDPYSQTRSFFMQNREKLIKQ